MSDTTRRKLMDCIMRHSYPPRKIERVLFKVRVSSDSSWWGNRFSSFYKMLAICLTFMFVSWICFWGFINIVYCWILSLYPLMNRDPNIVFERTLERILKNWSIWVFPAQINFRIVFGYIVYCYRNSASDPQRDLIHRLCDNFGALLLALTKTRLA